MTRLEWTQKILDLLKEKKKVHKNFLPEHITERTWLWQYPNQKENMRLALHGYRTFTRAGIEFFDFDFDTTHLTGNTILGLSRMPCPFYLEVSKNRSSETGELSIADPEYAILLKFVDSDIRAFARTFLA